jgi:hypothetical protein
MERGKVGKENFHALFVVNTMGYLCLRIRKMLPSHKELCENSEHYCTSIELATGHYKYERVKGSKMWTMKSKEKTVFIELFKCKK